MGKDFIKRYSILPLALFMTFSHSVAEASKRQGDPIKRVDEKSKTRRVESSGLLEAKDQAEKVRLRREAAAGQAEFNIGYAYIEGEGVEKDPAEGIRWFRKAAERGHARAQLNLGAAYFKGQGVEKDPAEGIRWFRKAADQGDAEAQYRLGNVYFYGIGIEKIDQAEGVRWYRRAADQGHAGAQLNLGAAYFNRQGVGKDRAEAVRLWRKAADQGDIVAQRNLGSAYFEGEGIAQDQAEGVRWLRKSADQGDIEAQRNLGNAYFKGEGVEKDPAEGAKWCRKAADQGDVVAQYILQVIEQGDGGLTNALSSSSQATFSNAIPEVRRNTETEQGKEKAPTSTTTTELSPLFARNIQAGQTSAALNSPKEKPIVTAEQESTALQKLETFLLKKSIVKAKAKAGDKTYQYELGVLYQHIRALYSTERLKEKHLDKAILWYQQAAAEHKGARDAFIELRNSGLYSNLDKEAMQWYEKAVTSSDLNFEIFIKASLDPSCSFKLSDLIVMELNDRELMPTAIEWGASQKPGATSDIFNPLFDPVRYGKSGDSIMAIDPSGNGEDETAFCIAKRCEDYYFITALGGMAGGYNKKKDRIGNSKEVLTKLANIARAHKIHYILIEKNNDNSYADLLKHELGDDIGIIKWHQSIRKENRIRDTIQPLLKDHRLILDRKALREDFESEPSKDINYKFFYQFITSTTTSSSSSSSSNPRGLRPASHDDRLDAVAMAINHLRVKREGPRQTEYVEEIL